MPSGTAWAIARAHRPGIAGDAELPRAAVPGRVLFVRLETPGFRPLERWLFTTLPEDEASVAELAALYAGRWQVELRYRELKATLAMESFDVRSAALFEKEREVGLLTHTLIRAAQLDAAPDVAAAGRRWLCQAWGRPAGRRRPGARGRGAGRAGRSRPAGGRRCALGRAPSR